MSAPIITFLYLSYPFEVICDASAVALGVVFKKRRDKIIYPIYYVHNTLNDAQKNYTLTEQELITLAFAFQ